MKTKFERAWIGKLGNLEPWKEISEDRAARECANAHGDDATKKLKGGETLETRFAHYRAS